MMRTCMRSSEMAPCARATRMRRVHAVSSGYWLLFPCSNRHKAQPNSSSALHGRARESHPGVLGAERAHVRDVAVAHAVVEGRQLDDAPVEAVVRGRLAEHDLRRLHQDHRHVLCERAEETSGSGRCDLTESLFCTIHRQPARLALSCRDGM